MKRILNKKMFLILGLFLFFLIINTKPAFASGPIITSATYNKTYIDDHIAVEQSPFGAFEKIVDFYNEQYPDSFTLSSVDLPEYALMISGTGPDNAGDDSSLYSTKYMFVYTSTPLVMDRVSTGAQYWDFDIPEGVEMLVCIVHAGGINFNTNFIEISDGSNLNPTFGHYGGSASRSVIASNYDIMSTDGLSTVFPQPTLRKVTTLAPVVNKVEMSPVLKEIIQILPLIIVVLVSFLGLRKALKMLSTFLNRS